MGQPTNLKEEKTSLQQQIRNEKEREDNLKAQLAKAEEEIKQGEKILEFYRSVPDYVDKAHVGLTFLLPSHSQRLLTVQKCKFRKLSEESEKTMAKGQTVIKAKADKVIKVVDNFNELQRKKWGDLWEDISTEPIKKSNE
jgi:septum formation inhibitor MinC